MTDGFCCPYCGGNPMELGHDERCDGKQGGVEDVPRFRDTSITAFYNAVNSGTLKSLQQHIHHLLSENGASTQMETNRQFQRAGLMGDSHSITPRFAELRDLGLIRETGERACLITGQMSITWEAIPMDEYQGPVVTKHRCETCGQLVRRSVA